MVDNSLIHLTQHFISVDLKGNGIKSGISADDRCKTIKALIKNKTKSRFYQDLVYFSSNSKRRWVLEELDILKLQLILLD